MLLADVCSVCWDRQCGLQCRAGLIRLWTGPPEAVCLCSQQESSSSFWDVPVGNFIGHRRSGDSCSCSAVPVRGGREPPAAEPQR